MIISKNKEYALKLQKLIQIETISGSEDLSKYYAFHNVLKEMFPTVFSKAIVEDFDGSLLLRIPSKECKREPILLMNHMDVVETPGNWTYDPFSGCIADGKIWGRGTLDDKNGLFCMLQAMEELLENGLEFDRDIYFEMSCTEEITGNGANTISQVLKERNIHFSLCLDEGGEIIFDPIGMAKATFAMMGVGEKGCADIQFVAKGNGGHASTPKKNSPLVRLGKFIEEVEKKDPFLVEMNPAIVRMFERMAPYCKEPIKSVFNNTSKLKKVIQSVAPSISPTAAALFKTTLAFTMAKGSDAPNVIPQEAYVIGNMRYSHHQGFESSLAALKKIAKKYDIEINVLDAGFSSPISDVNSSVFKNLEGIIQDVFPDVIPAPYIMTGASDSRFFSRVCDNCIRFAPFTITEKQMDSIHGIDENLDINTLSQAVEFYKEVIKRG